MCLMQPSDGIAEIVILMSFLSIASNFIFHFIVVEFPAIHVFFPLPVQFGLFFRDGMTGGYGGLC